MELPEAYIPIDRRIALAHGVDLPDRTHGAALFADISGFTPLTELLAKELGPQRGAEELTKQLITIYSALIAQVDQYRGSVISFSGDAITCWFDDEGPGAWGLGLGARDVQVPSPKSQVPAALRAVACALAMQEVMGCFATVETPSGASVTLAIKVATAAGPVRRCLAGDPQIQLIDVLAGATLDRLAVAEHQAGKGEVIASAEVAEQLGGAIEVREWREDAETGQRFAVVGGLLREVAAEPWPDLPPGALGEEQVRAWMLPGVYERLQTEQGQFLAELRPAVALFARFGGIDYDADADAAGKLDAYMRWAQRIVARYEGALLQLAIGDKGSYFHAAFGAPLAHDDDPDRAVAAALELLSLPPELSYIAGPQIGISRGRMRTGAYGGPTRRTYGVLGDDVNMAARLMGLADQGQILVSQSIADTVARRFTLRYVGPVSVKGKQAPVQVSEVLYRRVPSAQRPATLFASPLVGRETELARMTEMVEAAQSGVGQILRIEGTAGVGKSHLTAELIERAIGWGMRVAVGMCQSTTESTAYAPWRQILRALIGLSAEPGAGEGPAATYAGQIAAVEGFVAATDPGWLLRLPLLGDLLGLPIADNATTAAFEPKLRQQALLDLVVEMIQTWAQAQPLLLLVDDAHWMDEASKGLTVALGRAIGGTPLLLALAQRPRRGGARLLPELDEMPGHQQLNLDELSPQGVATLIAHRLGGRPSPLALSLIQAETQGNPFFVEEVVDTLRESGNLYRRENGEWWLAERMFSALQQANCLVRADGYWVLAPSASLSAVDLGLPDSIQGVVLSRIDRLPQAHKLTLKVASVIGRTFAIDLLSGVHPAHPSEAELVQQIELLEERDFTRLEVLQRLVYLFKHIVTRDVAYETLLFDQRRQLHSMVGAALERLAPDATAQLAYHSFAGEDWARALRYQALAGQQARKLFANHESIEHFRKALRCAERLPPEETAAERQQIHAGLGELLTSTGQYDPALEHLTEALALATALDAYDAQAHACRWIARLHENRGDYPHALEWIQRGLEALAGSATAAAAELLAIAGLIHTRQGNYDQAAQHCRDSLQIAETLGDTMALAFAYNVLGHITLLRGQSAKSIDYFQQSLDLYQQSGNIHGAALSHNQIANAYFNMGEWSGAVHNYRQARKIFNQTGDVYNLAITDNNLGELARYQGRLAEAVAFYQESLRSLEQIGGSRYVIGALHMNLGATFVRREEIDEARVHLRMSQEIFEQAEARDFLPELHRHFAATALLAGDLPEAEAQGQQALGLARELGMRGDEGIILRVLGDVAATRGDFREAEQRLNEGLLILEEVGDEYEGARTLLALAKVHLSHRRADQALDALQRCTDVFERLGATLDLLEAHAMRDDRLAVA
ncbi:MAG TPA: tetratricopeptide repeat protein [Roseiflexaceae bacterium]